VALFRGRDHAADSIRQLSGVGRIGHPLARSLCQQSLTTASRSKGLEPAWTPKLSKNLADETPPRPAFINLTS